MDGRSPSKTPGVSHWSCSTHGASPLGDAVAEPSSPAREERSAERRAKLVALVVKAGSVVTVAAAVAAVAITWMQTRDIREQVDLQARQLEDGVRVEQARLDTHLLEQM